MQAIDVNGNYWVRQELECLEGSSRRHKWWRNREGSWTVWKRVEKF